MKKYASIFIIAAISLCNSNVFSQTQPFKCDESRFMDAHGGSEKFNQLIDSACKEINAKNYEKAYRQLSEAITLDSIASAGSFNMYIGQQKDKLRKFIDSKGSEVAENKEVAQSEKVKEETPAKDEKKKNKHADKEKDKEPVKEVKDDNAVSDKKKNKHADKEKDPAKEVKDANADDGKKKSKHSKKDKDATKEIKSDEKETAKTETKNNNAEPTPKAPPAPVEEVKTPEVSENKRVEETGTKPLENTTTTQEPAPINDPPKTDETPKSNNSDKEIKTTEPSSSTKSFSVEELNGFHDKGNQKLKELEDYIKQISTKSTPNEIADQSTENAIKLFDSEDRMVEISSINSTVKTKKKIRKYLTSLRLLPYENIEIEWAEFLYTSDFIKGPDGNYHGYITFRQRFSATIGDKIPYTDITTKRTEIILKFYNKAVEGVQTENWDVFIGDISVEKTEKN